MVNVLVAHTFELDDAESVIAEILEQLDIENALRKNSVGIVACHAEFLSSGIVAALSEKLPFDLIGVTTPASAINGAMGVDILTLSVLCPLPWRKASSGHWRPPTRRLRAVCRRNLRSA